MIKTKLMEHQENAVTFTCDKPYAGLFLPFGSGKTLVALSLIDRNKWKRVVVVSTKTAITSTWMDEIEKHSSFKYCLLVGTAAQKMKTLHFALDRSYSSGIYTKPSKSTMIFLVNFDGVRNIFNELVAIHPDALFVDESTKIKSSRALRTKIMWALGRKCDHRFAMTGFPITENLLEIYSQIRYLDQGKTFGTSFLRFRQEYFFPIGFSWKPKKSAPKKIFDKLKDFCIMVPETVIKLPPKVYNKKPLEPTKQQKALLDGFKAYFQLELGKVKIDTDSVFTLLNKSIQICDGFVQDKWCVKVMDSSGQESVKCVQCGRVYEKDIAKKAMCPQCKHTGNFEVLHTPKDEALVETLEEINGKVIIWVNNRWTMKKLSKVLDKLGRGVLTLSGTTEDPGQVVRLFQNSSKYDTCVATLKKASESITMTACRHAIYYSQNWSYDLRGNSEARIRRKGSEKHSSIIYTDLYLKGTVDNLVYDCWRSKENVVNKLKRFFL